MCMSYCVGQGEYHVANCYVGQTAMSVTALLIFKMERIIGDRHEYSSVMMGSQLA